MATLYVAEYAILASEQVNGSLPQAPHEPPIVEQILAIGAGSVQSSPFNTKTTLVRLHCDAICSVLFGTNPTATTNNQRLAANQTEYKSVPLGQSYMVAVISNV